MLRIALVVLALLVAGVGLLWVFQRSLIYLPDGPPDQSATDTAGPTAREVTFDTEDGLRLAAWLVGPTHGDRGMHVLVAPGNAGHRGLRAPLARRLAAEGFSVLLLDYRGFGGNPGRPTEEGLAHDARAARAFLVEHERVRPDRILYFGESLGCAVVTRLAVEHPPAALVLRSPFTDLAAVGQRIYPMLPVRLLLSDELDVLGRIGRVRVPTLVVYGESDRLVPPEQSARVAAAAGGPVRTLALPGTEHNDSALLAGDELIAAVGALSPY